MSLFIAMSFSLFLLTRVTADQEFRLSCDLEFNIPKLNCNPFNSKSNLSCHVLAPKSDNTTVSLMLVRLRNGTLESLQHSEINQVLTHEELIKTSLWLAPALLDKKSHESIHIWCQALINNIPLIMMSFVDFNINLPPCQEKEYTLYYTRACINKRTAGLRNQSFKPHITERQADNTDDKCDNSKSCSGGEIGGIVVTVLFLVGSLIGCLVLIAYLAFKLYHKIDEEEPTTVARQRNSQYLDNIEVVNTERETLPRQSATMSTVVSMAIHDKDSLCSGSTVYEDMNAFKMDYNSSVHTM